MARVISETTITWDGPALEHAILRRAQSALRGIGSSLARELKADLRSRRTRKHGSSPEGQVPAMLTGTLSKAVTRDNRGLRKKRPWVRVGIDFEEAPYAGILEYGGVLKAKNKYMVIALNDEARAIQKAGQIGQGIAAKTLVVVPSKRGENWKWIVKRAAGKLADANDGITRKPVAAPDTFMFLLAKSIQFPPHPFIRPLVARRREWVLQQLRDAVTKTADSWRVGQSDAPRDPAAERAEEGERRTAVARALGLI